MKIMTHKLYNRFNNTVDEDWIQNQYIEVVSKSNKVLNILNSYKTNL